MKKLFFVFVLAFSSLYAAAKCAGSGLTLWPTGSTIKENPVLMLEGYAHSREIITGLNTTYAIYLQSGKTKIRLTVKETCTGQYSIKQAILVPAEALQPGLEYTLHIDNLPENESKLRKWNSVTNEYETAKWKVEKGNDLTAPTWIKKPWETKKTLAHYGCGPATFVYFGSKVKEDSDFLVRVTVKATRTSESTTYYLVPGEDHAIALGHGMCSGAFTFYEKAYEVSFDLMDASGNLTTWTDKKIKFTPPTEETESE